MKKILSLLLILCMLVPFAVAEEAAAVKTGLSFVTDLTSSKDGQAQANIAITAVSVDDNGVITQCVIDVIQGKVKFDETGKVTSDKAAEVQSKQELGDGYNMRNASPIKAEWFEQTASFCAFITNKTLNDAIAIAANPAETDVIATCTIKVGDFLKLIVKAGL